VFEDFNISGTKRDALERKSEMQIKIYFSEFLQIKFLKLE